MKLKALISPLSRTSGAGVRSVRHGAMHHFAVLPRVYDTSFIFFILNVNRRKRKLCRKDARRARDINIRNHKRGEASQRFPRMERI